MRSLVFGSALLLCLTTVSVMAQSPSFMGEQVIEGRQCPEFVRRVLKHEGYTLPGLGKDELGEAQRFFPRVQKGEFPGLKAIPNGSLQAPQLGDVLCFQGGPDGHLDMVQRVTRNTVVVIGQNWPNKPEATLTLEWRNNRFFVGTRDRNGRYICQGWVWVTNEATR